MVAILALVAAVAGGNLVMTVAPERPRVGRMLEVRATGQVGEKGRFFLYRNRDRGCAQSARGARRIGVRMADSRVEGSFDRILRFRPRRATTYRFCGYLYATSCDAAGLNCGEATGLPPDAGYFQVRVRVRPASH